MLDTSYDHLYNRALDVTAVIHISVKFVTMLVVVKYTPKNHRYHSYFVLHIMFWNFTCNMIFAFMHLNPLYPAECFRTDGPSSLLVDNETFGHYMFIAGLATTTHCVVALVSAFPYRYIVFAHPQVAASVKPYRVILLCCGVQVLAAIIVIPILQQWMVSYDNYPEKAELPDRRFVFCYYPYGNHKTVAVSIYLVLVVVALIVTTVFSILFLAKLRSTKQAIHSQTIALQRKLFLSLIVITGIILLFAGFPLLLVVFVTFFPHLPYARYTVMVCIVVLANHGSIYSIAYLILFKAYRDAVKRLIFKIIGKKQGLWPVKNYVVQSSVRTA